MISRRGIPGTSPLQMLVGVFHHHDGCINHRANRRGNAAETHNNGVQPQPVHTDKCRQNTDRQHQDRYQRTAHMQQEYDADQCNNRAFSSRVERINCVDKSVMNSRIPAPPRCLCRLACRFCSFAFTCSITFSAYFPAAGNDNTGGRRLHHSARSGCAAHWGKFNLRQIADPDWRAVDRFNHQLTNIIQPTQILARTRNSVSASSIPRPPDILIILRMTSITLERRDVVGLQFTRIEHHLILLHEAIPTLATSATPGVAESG